MGKNNDVVMINLDRPRTIRFGHKALKRLQAMVKKPIEEIEVEMFSDFEILEIAVYSAILEDAQENNEELKLEDIEDLLDQAENYKHIIESVQSAFLAAYGVKADETTEGNEPGKPPTKKKSTGKKA